MQAQTLARYIRISPRKVRLAIDTIRNKGVKEAFFCLTSLNKKAARVTEKVLRTAVANAKVKGMVEDKLYISGIKADGGPTYKRFMARAMGRADRMLRRTTHLTITLSEREKKLPVKMDSQVKTKKKVKT